jgi:hypothetical protein
MKEQSLSCGYGWYGLIFYLMLKLNEWNDKYPKYKKMKIGFFGEKWGALRLRNAWYPDYIEKPVRNAERASANICERCGCIGDFFDDGGWCHTLCADCAKALVERIYQQMEEMFGPPSEQEQVDSRREYIEKNMPGFLSELSILTQKYGFAIAGDKECAACPSINDTEYQGLKYFDLKYDCGTGRYTVCGLTAEQK